MTAADLGGSDPGIAPRAAGTGSGAEFEEWNRLDPRSLAIVVVPMLGAGTIYLVGAALGGVSLVDLGSQAAFALIAIATLVVRYLTARFVVVEGAVQWRSGLLVHRSTQIAIDRVQDVEVTRPLLARLFGLAGVIVSSAGGAGEIRLQYLDRDLAERFGRHLHELVAGERRREVEPSGVPGAPGLPVAPVALVDLHRVDGAELRWWALARVWPVPVAAVVSLVAVAAVGADPVWFAAAPASLLALVGLSGPALNRVGLHVVLDGDVVRSTAGLTTLRRTSTRRDRVQVLAGTQVPLQVVRGTESVRFASADVTEGDDEGGSVREELALDVPSGSWQGIATAVLGRAATGSAELRRKPVAAAAATRRRWLLIAMAGAVVVGVLVAAPRAVGRDGVLVPAALAVVLTFAVLWGVGQARAHWRVAVEGWFVSEDDLVVVAGVGWRRTVLVPLAKTQAVEVRHGVLQRRLGLATVEVDTAPTARFSRLVIADVSAAEAAELRAVLTAAGCRPLPTGT